MATVSTKVLENRPVLTVGQALQGSVANMTVSIGSGQATDSPSFNIRGTTSINGGIRWWSLMVLFLLLKS